MSAHSKIGASSYYRWKACPGSVRQSEGIESKSSVYAEEGTKAHDIAAKILMREEYEDPKNEEMMAAVKVYTDYVFENLTEDSQIWVEERFDLSEYFPGLFGTCDCIIYYPKLHKIRVIDYKHGAGIAVSPIENSQLMYYGAGALHSKNIPVKSVELVIVQPRCNDPAGAIKSWSTTPIHLMDYIVDLIADAKATTDPDAALNPGDHCRFCPAQPTCPALQERSLSLAKQAFGPISEYEPKKLSETLKMLPAIESWCKSVREFAYQEAERGRLAPGFKLVPKRAMRKWKDKVTAEFISLNFGLKYPEVVETKIKSPAQIEKLLEKDVHLLMLLNGSIDKVSSGNTLVEITDEREALDTKPKFDPITD